MSATATVLSPATSPAKKGEIALKRKQIRLIKTQGRQQVRNALADLRLEKAQEHLKKAQERVAQLEAKKTETAEKMAAIVAKQTADVETSRVHLLNVIAKDESKAKKVAERDSKKAEANRRKAEKAAKPKRVKVPHSVVTSSEGKTHGLTADQAATVKRLVGRRKDGILSPLAGKNAQELLLAVDGPEGSVGDKFQVRLRGRKQTLYFEVLREEEDGVAWWMA